MKLHCVHERAAEQPHGLEVSDAAHEIGCYTKSSRRKSWPCSSFVKPTSSTQISSAKTSHHFCSTNILLFATFLSSQGVKLCVHSGRLGGYVQVKRAPPRNAQLSTRRFGDQKSSCRMERPKGGCLQGHSGSTLRSPIPEVHPPWGGPAPRLSAGQHRAVPREKLFLYAHTDFSHVFVCSNVLRDLNAQRGLRKEAARERGCSAEPCPCKAVGEQSRCSR